MSEIRHKSCKWNRSTWAPSEMENYLLLETLKAFQLSFPDFPSFAYETKEWSVCMCFVCSREDIYIYFFFFWVSGGKVGVSPFKRAENKTGNHPLVLARGSYKCLEFWGGEFTCYVHVCAQVRACTHKHIQAYVHTQRRECLACFDKQRHEDLNPLWMLWGAIAE